MFMTRKGILTHRICLWVQAWVKSLKVVFSCHKIFLNKVFYLYYLILSNMYAQMEIMINMKIQIQDFK